MQTFAEFIDDNHIVLVPPQGDSHSYFVIWIHSLIIYLQDRKSPIFIQKRVGKKKKLFYLIKFRTMRVGTASVATHLSSKNSITFLGKILRKTKLDELPQLWNVMIGDMSIVGPRPCLINQEELIKEREKLGIFNVLPGVTGLAQINSYDGMTLEKKSLYEEIYLKEISFALDFYIILRMYNLAKNNETPFVPKASTIAIGINQAKV